MDLLNLFSLHGRYFENDENRLTASVLCLLSEFRGKFLSAFLEMCGLKLKSNDHSRTKIYFQVPHQNDSGVCRVPDAEIRLDDVFQIVIEAKIGMNPLGYDQLAEYAKYLSSSSVEQRRLVCITQSDCFEYQGRSSTFEELRSNIEPHAIDNGSCVWIQWQNLLDLMKSSLQLTAHEMNSSQKRVLKGRTVRYSTRLCSLFLREVETKMYGKKDIDSLLHGEVEDAVIAVQNPWFMNVALKHHVWFPSNLGGRAARYVAHYETGEQESTHPCQIAFIARNRLMWNRITVREAMAIPDLERMFADSTVLEQIRTWDPKSKHCIVLTDRPEQIERPIGLGAKRNLPRIMSGRFFSLPTLANARSIDDLC